MDNGELIKRLTNNLEKHTSTYVDSSLLKITIFYKEVAEIRQRKMDYFDNFIQVELQRYNQSKDKHRDLIEELREEYDYQMTKVEHMYAKLYLEVTKYLDNAIDNQNNAVANIISYEQRMANVNATEAEKVKGKIIEKAELKKIQNYNVIVKECIARLKWCKDEAEKILEESFPEKSSQEDMTVAQDGGILEKIIHIFTGGYKFINTLNTFEATTLKEAKDKVDENIDYAAGVLVGVTKQVKNCKKQIKEIYERQVSAAN